MKLLFQFLAFSACIQALASSPGPRVPATIEIAEVKLKITAEAQRQIQKDVDALRLSEKYFQIKLDRVNLYFPIIEKILKEEGVPDDLKYLSVQESGLISDAVSSADAVGYWMFKDFTAREVGLRVDGKVDERINIVSSTRGATRYFKRNNYLLKNWLYSVNAYMTGPTGVKKYVNEKDIGSDRMVISGKTHWYVKRFIAHVIAFKDEVGGPHPEGLKLIEYKKGKNKTLDHIAKELKIDAGLLKDYNKWLKHGKVPDDKDYSIIVPTKGRLPSVAKDTKSNDPPPLSRRIEEPKEKVAGKTVSEEKKNVFIKRNGRRAIMATASDNAVSLSLKANILTRQLIKFNDLKNGQSIEGGNVYYAQSKSNRSDIPFHTVQQGESLWEVSQKYGVKLDKILKMNRMKTDDELKAGRVLWMKKTRPKDTPIEYKEAKKINKTKPKRKLQNPEVVLPASGNSQKEIEEVPEVVEEVIVEEKTPAIVEKKTKKAHTVQPGEGLWSISKKYDLTVDNLKEWNGMDNSSSLHPGQELQLSPTSSSKKKEDTKAKTYTVTSGDSLWGVARKFDLTIDELKSLNNKQSNELSVGEVLKVR